jgi:hypothetical protein
VRLAYAVALAWVLGGAALYFWQLLKLASDLG